MNPANWLSRCSALLSERAERNQLRRRVAVEAVDSTHLRFDGRVYLNFSSNNYLGLTHHPKLINATKSVSEAGSGAAGLITGHTEAHARAEQSLARWKGMESAVLLPSGYQANLAAVGALSAMGESYSGGVRFLVDKLVHASLIDAVRATGAAMRVFPHNGMAKLRRLLEQAEPDQLQIVLSESIFSMDGDRANMEELARLREEFGCVLLLDEAHGSGVYGRSGSGLAAELGLQGSVDVSVVTLSKAMGFAGGAVCSSPIFSDALVNFGRGYIYSTSVPPMIPACLMTSIEVMTSEPWRQQRVRALAKQVRAELSHAGLEIPDGDSPIVPIILGAESAVLEASQRLKELELWVVAVRPPTVAPGSSRLRVTLNCDHTDQDVTQLVEAIKQISR